MRSITADYIFPISSPPIKNGVVIIDDNGIIKDIGDSKLPTPDSGLQTYNGFICPGFINTHCHLELSHLKGAVAEKQGMAGFIKELLSKRNNFSKEEIYASINSAEKEMIANGIVAVGDISNDDSTFEVKSRSKIKYHTFIEIFDLDPLKAAAVFKNAKGLSGQLPIANCQFSIAPHAPYTVSEKLFELIAVNAKKENSILSIHNQESQAEQDLFKSRTGSITELFGKMNIDLGFIPPQRNSSIQYSLLNMPVKSKVLLVHNTYTSKEDIKWTHKYYSNSWQKAIGKGTTQDSELRTQNSELIYWCFCPNANLYIENKLPDFDLFISEEAKITIGTDSYASNWNLSVLDELKTIAENAPHILLQTLLTWATKNGAEFLGFDQELGTIEKGKKPGLNLIKNVDLNNLQLTSKSKIEVLV